MNRPSTLSERYSTRWIRLFSSRAHLIGVFELYDADAAAVIAQLVHQRAAGVVDVLLVILKRRAQSLCVDRFAGREEHGHQRPL